MSSSPPITSRHAAACSKSIAAAAARIFSSASVCNPPTSPASARITPVHPFAVVLGGLQADTGRRASTDVMIQAGARRRFARQIVATGADALAAQETFESAADPSHLGVGPEIARPILMQPAGEVDAGKVFGHCDANAGVLLVVAQMQVEAGLMLLDEVGFEDQRLGLGTDHQRLDGNRLARELAGSDRGALCPREIGAHPMAQRLGLAHIQDLALRAPQQIDARFGRKFAHSFVPKGDRVP